jgi:UDP-galactopyranose mutase
MNTHPTIVRIAEMNQLQAKKNTSETRVLCFDFANSKTNRFYPVDTERNRELLKKYFREKNKFPHLVLHGRTSEYKYKDIDDCIEDSIRLFKKLKKEKII